MAQQPELRPVGVTYGGQPSLDGAAEALRLQISRAATLADLSREYAFYTEALLYANVPLGAIDPYADFLATLNAQDPKRISLSFSRPIFEGLDIGTDPRWNHALLGLPRIFWEPYQKFVGGIAFHDRDRGLLTRLRVQTLQIADPLYFDKAVILPEPCPTVQITAFVLDTNHGCRYFQTGAHPLWNPPKAVHDPRPYDDTLAFAYSLRDEHAPNPYGLIDAVRSQRQGRAVEEVEIEKRVRKARENQTEVSD